LRIRDAVLSFAKAASLFYPPSFISALVLQTSCYEILPEAKESNLGLKIFLFIGAEPLDSDGDGFSNLAEIHDRPFPGDPKSYK
jgi:hypothetical protein